MADLHFLIDRRSIRRTARGEPDMARQQRLYARLRAAILDGRIQPGAVLPATRALAHDLGIARNSVVYAYEQLAAEGYTQATRRGTVVLAGVGVRPGVPASVRDAAGTGQAGGSTSSTAGPPRAMPLAKRVQAYDRRRTPEDDMRPFMPGMPALDAFPIVAWRRLMERSLRQIGHQDLGYRHPCGEPELRQAIATYLRVARGVRCHADQVVITDGTQQSLGVCAHLLADPGEHAWIEHPGYGGARTALEQAGLRLTPVTVDADGLNPPEALWHQRPPKLIYTTPSHQYPLGSVLTLARRLALIDQARQCGAWILEDDYDSEFRHDGPPLAAMQGLADDAPVVYLGTFSKSLFPSLRTGFIVLPEAIAHRAEGVISEMVRRGHVATQRTLAAFIDDGHFTTHLRRMRKLYALRQAALRDALARHWTWPGTVLGGQCGMHLVLSLPAELRDARLARAAYEAGLSPRPLSMYGTGGIDGFNGLVMGYANTPQEAMDRHVQTVARAARAVLA